MHESRQSFQKAPAHRAPLILTIREEQWIQRIEACGLAAHSVWLIATARKYHYCWLSSAAVGRVAYRSRASTVFGSTASVFP